MAEPLFSTEVYSHELQELGALVDQIEDPALKAGITDRVNRMQMMLRPIVDSHLADEQASRLASPIVDSAD